MNKLKKIIPILVIVISIINIILTVTLIFKNIVKVLYTDKIYTNVCVIILILQIITIIISTICLKLQKTKKYAYLLNILSIVILLISFFMPVQKNYSHPSSSYDELTIMPIPSVMPIEYKDNIYGITIRSDSSS